MKKKLFFVFLILFQFVGSAQFLRTPYPIIFVHGISGEYTIWDSITTHLSNNFGPTQVVNVVLNAAFDTTHYLDDVIIEFEGVSPLPNVNFFAVNFKNWWNRDRTHPSVKPGETHNNPLESRSNESAIFKQGYALKLVIQKVLNATNADGVILVGHSMGGLAIREYLQRNDHQGSRMWWIDKNDTIAGHRVKKVLTLNTPHLGANILELPTVQNSPDPVTLYSEAARDLIESYKRIGVGTYPGVYLFGGEEKQIKTYSTFHNYDVNCNGKTTDTIIGISQDSSFNPNMSLPTNIYYTWGTSSLFEWPPPLVGDLVVKTEHMWLRNQQGVVMPEGADTIFTNATHTNVYNQLEHLLRGLDEPNSEELAYDFTPKDSNYVILDREIGGFVTQPAQRTISPDYDYYKIKIPAPGDLKVWLFSYLSGVEELAVLSGNNTVLSNSIPGEVLLHADAGMYHIRIKGNPEFYTWSFPYTLSVKYEIGTPPQKPDNLRPLNGAIFVHQNISVDWSDVDKAKTYEFQLAKDSLFSNLVYSQTGLTSSTIDVSNLELEKKYYWRVRSVNYWGTSEWSSVWSFTTEDAVAVGKVNSTPSGGNWGNSSTWIDGKVPSENEDVVIRGPVTIGNDNYCKTLIIMGQGSIQSGNQSNSNIHLSGNLLNYGTIKDNQTGFSLNVWVAGSVTNLNEISASSLVFNGSGNQFIGQGNENSFNCNISFSNSGGDLVAGSPLILKRNVSLGGGKLQIGEYTTKITEGGTVSGGEIVGKNLYYYSTALFRDMLFNVRNLFMRGMLFNCTFQGPVSFHDRIQISKQTVVNGDLTVRDTLECVDIAISQHNNLYINGNFANDGLIFDRGYFQNYLNIIISGHLTNNGQMTNFGVSVAGNVANNQIMSNYGLSLNGTGDQHLLLGSGKDFSIYNISFTNTTGSLIADSDLRFSGTVNLATGKFVTGDYSVTGGYIIGGKIEQSAFRFYGEGTLRDAQLNVRNLFVNGDLLNCTLQGPVTFHNRIRNNVYNLINGDLIIQDTLENFNTYSSSGHTLEVNGNLINLGLITDNATFNQGLRLITQGNITNQGWMLNTAYTLTGHRPRTLNVGENCTSIFSSEGDSVILIGQNRLPNLSVIAGSCVLHENSELVIFGNKIQGNFKNFGKVIVERPNYHTATVYDFFMSSIKLGIQPNFNKLTVASLGYQTPTLFGTAIKNYWSVLTEPSSYFDAQVLNFEYKDDMLNGNDESRLEVFHSNNGQNNWQKVSSPSNISRNPEMNSVQISNIPIQGYFALASSANFPEVVVLSLPQNDQLNEPIPVKLVWRKANMDGRYMLSVAKDSLFSQIVVADSSLTDTVRILSSMDYNSSYYWRVRAGNQLGWGDWSNTWRFTTIIEKPSNPVLALPINQSKGLLNPITAKWNKSLRVEKYKLQVSADSLFGSFIVNDSTLTDTTRPLPNLANYSQYYWRVKAVNVGGVSDWSSIWNFKTLGNPYASNLITPLDASVNQPLNSLTFKWTKAKERIETFQKYQLQISTDSLFSSTFINDSTLTDTTKIVGGMGYLTKYFWRVRAQNQTGWGDWSNTWRFTTIIEKPSIPLLALPLNNTKGLLNPITAKWNKSLRVEKYKLQVSTDSLFGTLVINDSTLTDTTKVLPNLANYSQYYWRVKAVNVGGESDWSTVWNFKTLGNPYASNLIIPLDASVNQPLNGLTFKWTKAKERIETIQKYQFQLSTDSLFTTTFVNDSTLTDTTKIVGGMGYFTRYFWRVRAQNQTGWGDWSNTWRFTTVIEKPTIPVLALPLNNTKGLLNPITAKWNKSLRVEKYKLQVSTDSLFGTLVMNDSTLADTTKLLPSLANYSQYYWRVKAVNVGGESDWSTVWNFKTLGNPYASNLLTPLDASVNQPLNELTFKWTKAKERIETIQKYQFQISTDSLFTTVFVNDSTLTDTMKVVGGMGYLTKYFWRVRAQNQTGWGDWSNTWRFTTIIEKPTIPLLALPGNGSKGLLNPITAKWNKSLRVEKYGLQVSTDSLFGSFIVNDSTLTDTTKLLPMLANYSQYYWRVKAVNVGGESDWSSVWNFKTLGNPYASNLLIPMDASVNQPLNGLTFKWSKARERIETIQRYQLQISTDSLFTTNFVNDSTLTDTTKVVGGMGYLTKYFWRVRAQNQTGWGDWSNTWRFTTIIDKPTVPLLAFPMNGSKGLPNPIIAKWNKSLRVEKYKLQVSSDSLFSSFVVNDSTLTDTTKVLPNLANYSQYYWRVKAVNVGGESDWSAVWNFKTLGNPYSVILASPGNGAVNNPVNNVTFRWFKPQERAETILKYHFQLSTDSLFGSIAFSDSTFIMDTTTTGSGLSYLTTYFWRVRAKNETGWGDWSQVWSLTTVIEKPSVPLLASPANNATQQLQPVILKWKQSLRVEKYTLEVSESSNFTTLFLVDSTLTDTMRTLPQLQTPRTYYWRVKARNIGGTSEYSTVWNFRTLGFPIAVNLIAPANGSVNLPINGVLLKWLTAGEQTLGSVTSGGKGANKAMGDSEKSSDGKEGKAKGDIEQSSDGEGRNTPKNGNLFATGSANPTSGIESIGKYWLEIKTDTSSATLFYSDSTLTDTTKLMSGFGYLTTYFWRVKANNEVGWGSFSGWFKFTTIIERPTQPVLASPANNSLGLIQPVTVKWNRADRAERYTLEVSSNAQFTTVVFKDTTITDTTKTLPALSPLTTYYWRVSARNTGGVSDTSSVWNFKTLGTPTVVTLVTPENNAVNVPIINVVFKWTKANDRLETIQRYRFELKTDTTSGTFVVLDTLLTDTTKIVASLQNLTGYYWRISAKNEAGWGEFTPWNRFTTVKKPIATPTALTAIATAVKKVTLSWTDNSDNELGFIILRKSGDSTSTATLVRIDSVGANITEFIDSTVTDTSYYSYKVMAYNADTLSNQSNYATVFTLTGIKEFAGDIPKEFNLYQNYPNPFNPSTIIRFAIPKDAHVEIELYSIHGELVQKLVSEDKHAGYYEISLEIPSYASGVYFYRIVASTGDKTEPFVQTRKLILMK